MKNKPLRICATIEARMGSQRLAGKMGLHLYPGLTALGAVIERVKKCAGIDQIVVATTIQPQDDRIEEIAKGYKVECFRGSEKDVLGRVVKAGQMVSADALVLVTGDCACISPWLIDKGVEYFRKHDFDLVTNCLTDTYPIGIDLQVVKFTSLVKAHDLARQPPHNQDKNNFEHTNFFIRNNPGIFLIYEFAALVKYNRPDIALALDTRADLEVIRNIYKHLYRKNKLFDIDDILGLLKRKPDILKPLKEAQVNRTGIKNA